MTSRLINMVVLHQRDNVGIALRAIMAGEVALAEEDRELIAGEDIPQGHKIALAPIGEGERIVRFGVPVGIATASIGHGRLVHTHNVRSQYLDNDEDHYE